MAYDNFPFMTQLRRDMVTLQTTSENQRRNVDLVCVNTRWLAVTHVILHV
jgi:hypothetical protein